MVLSTFLTFIVHAQSVVQTDERPIPILVIGEDVNKDDREFVSLKTKLEMDAIASKRGFLAVDIPDLPAAPRAAKFQVYIKKELLDMTSLESRLMIANAFLAYNLSKNEAVKVSRLSSNSSRALRSFCLAGTGPEYWPHYGSPELKVRAVPRIKMTIQFEGRSIDVAFNATESKGRSSIKEIRDFAAAPVESPIQKDTETMANSIRMSAMKNFVYTVFWHYNDAPDRAIAQTINEKVFGYVNRRRENLEDQLKAASKTLMKRLGNEYLLEMDKIAALVGTTVAALPEEYKAIVETRITGELMFAAGGKDFLASFLSGAAISNVKIEYGLETAALLESSDGMGGTMKVQSVGVHRTFIPIGTGD